VGIVLLVLILSLPCALPGWSQVVEPGAVTSASSQDRSAIDSARALLLEGMRRSAIPGAAVTVMRNGHVVWSEGLGWADVENQIPVSTLTKFRIASISKPLTATAVGLLVERGKLDLDAPVQRYVPSFPQKAYPITTRQLAGHLAGVRHYASLVEFQNQRHYDTVLDALNIFKNDSLLFRPGDRFSYSSYGWILISAVVEGAAGEPFLTFMRQQVFDPIGMRQTTAEYPDSIIPNRARFYTRRDSLSPVLNALYIDNSPKWASGGFLSTTEDLAVFGQAMLSGELLKRTTVELLWTSQRTNDGKATGYGIGWGVATDSSGRQLVVHDGSQVGGSALLVLYPKQQLVFAFLFNSDQSEPALLPIVNLFLSNR
jgi:serine beta-lactamase-like protein LACTB, mitochondrial